MRIGCKVVSNSLINVQSHRDAWESMLRIDRPRSRWRLTQLLGCSTYPAFQVPEEEFKLRLTSDPFKPGKYNRVTVKVVDICQPTGRGTRFSKS